MSDGMDARVELDQARRHAAQLEELEKGASNFDQVVQIRLAQAQLAGHLAVVEAIDALTARVDEFGLLGDSADGIDQSLGSIDGTLSAMRAERGLSR